jgi:hypothetical protein
VGLITWEVLSQSTYVNMFLPTWLSSTVLERRENVDPTFFSPSGILMKQYVPKGVMKLVLALSSSFIYIYLVISGESVKE